jgi:gluconate 2-dehydrogenase
MKPSIVLYKSLPRDLYLRLEQHFTVHSFEGITDKNLPEIINALQHAQGLLGAGGTINKTLLDKAPQLRAVSTISVGYDNFDVDELTERQIPLMHTPTVLTDTVADTVMALTLGTARRVVELANRVKQGEWTKSIDNAWYGMNVHHKTIGIVGMGRIGMAVAQRAYYGFNMPVLYHARSQHQEAETRFNAKKCDLNTLLTDSDFVCVILPLNQQTYHMLGEEQFAKMKSSGILISVGRGPVIDEKALISALEQGVIAGAGMDVFEQEPIDVHSPLLNMDNVVALPHIGSATHETRYEMAACAVDNLIAALTGEVHENCVNPQVFAHH